ncbi:MAG: proline--tRNA ligase [Spirochaetaceae bacterium]|jgi:prolyl-tRNA synthetase|nr:proline--tRNA ligase [Spirochaetaceae bacterium]
MKFSEFYLPTLREGGGDAIIASHRLMFRSGMIRKLSNGLFAYLPLGLRSFRKLENIIREEIEAIGAREIKAPVVVPGELWKESGRWDSMGDALLRAKNRLNVDLVVSPTAEEAFTAIVREDLFSYKQLPVNLYQINTKYRDEIRPRYGVMRAREFVMFDAYSFHVDEESLDSVYKAMGRAYKRIFKRCGLSVIPVKADSGAMGGAGSEEFMVESLIGDNILLLCPACDYSANVEKAGCQADFTPVPPLQEAKTRASSLPAVEIIDTPEVKTIAELCTFLKTDAKNFIKTLIYRALNVELDLSGVCNLERKKPSPDALPVYPEVFVAVCIRGDLDVNEVKLASVLKAAELALASEEDVRRITQAPLGFAGPVGLSAIPIIADESALAIPCAFTGALAEDKHYKNVVYGRDWTPFMSADLRTVKAGDKCPVCGEALYEKKGNELGHIFKLGKKYSTSMHLAYLDETGKSQIPTMGCYGIGLDRTLASVIEEHHDEAGIIWTATLAPFDVIIVPVKYDGEVKAAADELAAHLQKYGIDVLLDDRAERAGVKFNDADLIGIPYRVVVGDKNLSHDPPEFEIKKRGSKDSELIERGRAADYLAQRVRLDIEQLNGDES